MVFGLVKGIGDAIKMGAADGKMPILAAAGDAVVGLGEMGQQADFGGMMGSLKESIAGLDLSAFRGISGPDTSSLTPGSEKVSQSLVRAPVMEQSLEASLGDLSAPSFSAKAVVQQTGMGM